MKKRISIILFILISGIIVIGLPKIFPQLFYKKRIEVKNYTIYSNKYIDSSIVQIIDTVDILMSNKMIDKKDYIYDVYLSNSYFLFWLHTFLNKLPTGASDFVTNNIYIANANLVNNYAYNFTNNKTLKVRSVHSVIAHESVHILLRKELGFRKYRKLIKHCNWKIEGLCEWIAFNDIEINKQEIKRILESETYINNPYDRYKVYRALVDYLIREGGYNLKELMNSNDNFDDIIRKYATQHAIRSNCRGLAV